MARTPRTTWTVVVELARRRDHADRRCHQPARLQLAAGVLALDPPGGRLAGMLGLAVALPMLLLGMEQEIIAFIGWIALQRRCGRGLQVPGVQRLLPDSDKTRVLRAQLPTAVLLTAVVLWPSAWLTRAAGLALLLTWLLVWWSLDGVRRRSNRFALAVVAERRTRIPSV